MLSSDTISVWIHDMVIRLHRTGSIGRSVGRWYRRPHKHRAANLSPVFIIFSCGLTSWRAGDAGVQSTPSSLSVTKSTMIVYCRDMSLLHYITTNNTCLLALLTYTHPLTPLDHFNTGQLAPAHKGTEFKWKLIFDLVAVIVWKFLVATLDKGVQTYVE